VYVLTWHTPFFSIRGETVQGKAGKEGAAAAAACAAAAALALRADASCAPAPAAECGFAGAWGGGGGDGAAAFYVSSYFWDRAAQAGAIPAGAIDAPATPRQFGDAATAACDAASAASGLQAAFPAAPADGDDAALFCLDLAYCHTLLTRGFGLEEDAPITLVKQVKYKGDAVEAAWPLGAAIDALGAKTPAAGRR
jgi:apyrase